MFELCKVYNTTLGSLDIEIRKSELVVNLKLNALFDR